MDPSATRPLGRSGLQVGQLGLGGAPLGELFVRVSEADSLATIHAAWDGGIRTFDTAPWYGRGLSELRMGAGLREVPRDAITLSSKVGRWLRPTADPASFDRSPWVGGLTNDVTFDYSYDGLMRAFEQSRLRLGVGRLDLAVIHDLDHLYHGTGDVLEEHFRQLIGSGWRALEELKAAGLIRAVGAGVNATGLAGRFLDHLPLDFFLAAMPYTLLDQGMLDAELPLIEDRGIGIVVGAPFASGILASGAVPGARYNYAIAPPEIVSRVARIERVCQTFGVPLAAAALQFPLGHPAVTTIIPGATAPDHVQRNLRAFRHPVPAAFWETLRSERLIRPDAPVPAGQAG